MLEFMIIEADQLGVARMRMGNANPYVAPVNTYRSKEGAWVSFTASTQSIVDRLFTAIGMPELSKDPRFRTNTDRVRNRADLDEILSSWFRERTQDEIAAIFDRHGVPFSPILDAAGIMSDVHYAAREAIVHVADDDLGMLAMQGIIPKFSATPGAIRWAGPRCGQHNREIFSGFLGIDEDGLAELAAEGVIAL
jgi:crotonobetainyl-CoA:carnitine CoA-transferase CaiB-like acyl-CoA transferase